MENGEATTVAMSSMMQRYFDSLKETVDECYQIANEARKKGCDPSFTVEIPQALDLAARVEELVGPKDIAPSIRAVTKKISNREMVSLEIARTIAKESTGKRVEDALDQSIRTGLAILTEGVLVAPLEGIAEVKLGTNHDGSNYVDLYFSGPIRSAGGTGQAMSVLIADVVRRQLGIDAYKPTEKEIERYKEEIPLYKRVQHLQYTPSSQEIHQIVSNCPICINGEGTEDEEVTGNRDLPRVESNRLRGGACLVIAEGLCLKAPKLLKHVSKLKLKGWEFLDTFVHKKGKEENVSEGKEAQIPEILPSTKYIEEVIAGRPVFSHPSRIGGFRLRYGRARTAGLASTAISPLTMELFNGFVAVGTQMKMERPGKATIGTPCDELEGPIVLLTNGDLIQVDLSTSVDLLTVKQIIDVGEILIPYGEFLENNALLPTASYTFEWWIQDLQKALGIDVQFDSLKAILAADETAHIQVLERLGKPIDLHHPSYKDAVELAQTFAIPLHPEYNLFWHDLEVQQVLSLAQYIKENGFCDEKQQLHIPCNKEIKEVLISLGVLHVQRDEEYIVSKYAPVLLDSLGLHIDQHTCIETEHYQVLKDAQSNESVITVVSTIAGYQIRERAPFRIGTRMGRPEKAAERKMRPPPHALFPLGNYGSNQRLFSKAAEFPSIEFEAGKRVCPNCDTSTYKIMCDCGAHTEPVENRIETFTVSVHDALQHAKKSLHLRTIPDTIKGVQGTISKHKTPEPIEKGMLRAKHEVSVFKDGTIRFDMTDAPLTHFKPYEIHVTVDALKALGYETDHLGNPLERDDQICELKVQDVIISKSCAEYFMKVANYIDELLIRFYQLSRYYQVKRLDDLTGHLVIGLAPHTSGGSLARIIGFTNAQVCFSHPFYHAAKRRNCDGDEDGLMLLMDALLNFSLSYIPDKRGGRMDLPLILTIRLDPSEVDKEAHNVDTLYRYPLAFYEATQLHKHPKEVEQIMGTVGSRIGTPLQYEQFGFTHDTQNICAGPVASRYKTLKTMMEKMNAQLELAAKIRAVDEADVAYKVIERHFLPDILGNLRAFSKQSVRCPSCNITYRRIPLTGKCRKCEGKLSLTVHEKSVKKYLDISKEVADKYHISSYACQRINLVEQSIDSLFMSDKVRKTKLTDFL